MAYLPTVEFGPGMTSATQIRAAWPSLDERRKTALVMSLYPKTQTSPKLAQTVVKLLDTAIGGEQGVLEDSLDQRIAHAKKNNPLQASVRQHQYGYTALVTDANTGKPSWFGGAVWQTPELAMGHAKAFVKGFPYLEQRFAQRFVDKNFDGIADQGAAEGAPIVVAQSPIDVRNPKKAPQPYRNQGDIVPPTKPPSTEKRGVKGRPGQRPMPDYTKDVDENQGWAATFTNEDDYIEEKWSSKYKSSINCAAPRGFSQRAHCAGRKK